MVHNLLLPFLLTFSCPKTIIVNKSKEPWSELDQRNLDTFIQNENCDNHYDNHRLPCLVKIIKKGFNDYRLICGEERNGNN